MGEAEAIAETHGIKVLWRIAAEGADAETFDNTLDTMDAVRRFVAGGLQPRVSYQLVTADRIEDVVSQADRIEDVVRHAQTFKEVVDGVVRASAPRASAPSERAAKNRYAVVFADGFNAQEIRADYVEVDAGFVRFCERSGTRALVSSDAVRSVILLEDA